MQLAPQLGTRDCGLESNMGALRATVMLSCYRTMSSKSEECAEMMIFRPSSSGYPGDENRGAFAPALGAALWGYGVRG